MSGLLLLNTLFSSFSTHSYGDAHKVIDVYLIIIYMWIPTEFLLLENCGKEEIVYRLAPSGMKRDDDDLVTPLSFCWKIFHPLGETIRHSVVGRVRSTPSPKDCIFAGLRPAEMYHWCSPFPLLALPRERDLPTKPTTTETPPTLSIDLEVAQLAVVEQYDGGFSPPRRHFSVVER